jgi:hypothetical protein
VIVSQEFWFVSLNHFWWKKSFWMLENSSSKLMDLDGDVSLNHFWKKSFWMLEDSSSNLMDLDDDLQEEGICSSTVSVSNVDPL